MSRERTLPAPASMDGPYLAAILSALDDIHDLLDARLPQRAAEPAADGVVELREPATPGQRKIPDPPPRTGRGSSVTAWQRWASEVGVPVPTDASRDDTIAACVEAGAITADAE